VLCVVGLGDSVKVAQKVSVCTVDHITYDGAQFRRDIGWRGAK
jgi:phosphoribosylamine--glycine ligase